MTNSKTFHFILNLPGHLDNDSNRTLPRANSNMVAKRGWSNSNTRNCRSTPDQDGFVRVQSRTSYPRIYSNEDDDMKNQTRAVPETHDGKMSTGRKLAQYNHKSRPKYNRFDVLEEVVDRFTTDLSEVVRQEVAAFKSANNKTPELNRSGEEVYTPHLFDELPSPKKKKLNDEAKKIIFMLRNYFQKVKKEAAIYKYYPPGFRQRANHKPIHPNRIHTMTQKTFNNKKKMIHKKADCCGCCSHAVFYTTPCEMTVAKERAFATSNQPQDKKPDVTVETRDLIHDNEEEEETFHASLENIRIEEHDEPSPIPNASTNTARAPPNAETVRSRDERRNAILAHREIELLVASSSSDDDDDSYSYERESKIPVLKRKKLQSKLLKGLLKDAKLQRLRTFKMNEDPTIRRIEFHQWLLSVQAITSSYVMLIDLLQDYPHTISAKIESQIGNVALFYFLRNYVDTSIQYMFQSHPEDGVACLHLLRRHCAQLTDTDTSTFYTRFAITTHHRDEHILNYIQRFNAAKVMAESVGNTFSDSQLLQLFIGNFTYPGIYTSTVNTIKARIVHDQFYQETHRLTFNDATTLLLQVESERNQNIQNNERTGRNRH